MGADTSAPNDGLYARNLRVRFGGLVAVDDVELQAPRGRITGLIGPNGAGKTTTFNACCGMQALAAGSVHFDGDDITSLSPQARARRGIGRTFQRMELFDSLSVADNVALGREAGFAGSNPLRQLIAGREERSAVAEATADALARCGIADLAHRSVGSLSTGQRRLVELARVLAGPFSMLLLDEPSSGLDGEETERFGAILLDVLSARDIGVLLVEHDMSLVMRICSYLYVLDFGQLIFEGTPEQVRASEVVRSAYLGTEAA
jgi:ABC-type branched-subunit amino acid transport system ATPase component